MGDKENELFPISIDEISKIFFGDEEKSLDLGRGRPKKEGKEETVSIPSLLSDLQEEDNDDENQIDDELYPTVEVNDKDKKISAEEKRSLDKQIRFLKKYEERKKKLEKIQTTFDLDKNAKIEIKQKLKQEKQKKRETQIKDASHLVRFRDPTGCLYGKNGKICVTECKHLDTYDGIQANQVITRCTKCSRIKNWDPKEWEFYQQNKHKSY